MSTYALAREILQELFRGIVLTPTQDARALELTERWVERLSPAPVPVQKHRKALRLAAWAGIVAVVMGLALAGVYLVAPRLPVAVPAVVVIVPVGTPPSFVQELINMGPGKALEHAIPTDMRTRFPADIDITDIAQFEWRVFISLQLPDTQEHWVVAYEYRDGAWIYVGKFCQSCGVTRAP